MESLDNSTLADEIYWKSKDKNANKTNRKILDTSWRYLPNCRDFEIKIGKEDPLLAKYHVNKRLKASIKILPYENGSLNRFALHQILRLKRSTDNPRKFWFIAWTLMRRSNVFRVMAINHVFPQWHKREKLHFILNVNRQVSKLINNGLSNLDTKRVWIPKTNSNKLRPLGVPTPAWRIYLHMINNFLHMYVQKHIPVNQHGFLPNRGTLTAWKEFFEKKVYEQPDIWEYDFRSYFDKINIQYLGELLLQYKLPVQVTTILISLNLTRPHNWMEWKQKIRSWVEPRTKEEVEQRWRHHAINEAMLNLYKSPIFFSEREFATENFRKEWLRYGTQYIKDKSLSIYQGVAQGAPTSPLLAILCLNPIINNRNIIQYADDGFIYGRGDVESEFRKLLPTESGIEINEEKSSWVKRNGVWLKPLQFLGLNFDGKTLKARTRNGADLILDHKKLEMIEEHLIEREGQSALKNRRGTWKEIFRSKLIGFIQSRLYQNKWNLRELEQNFSYTFIHGSWADKEINKSRGLNIYNSSSFACLSLWNMLRYNQKLRKPRRNLIRLIRI
jgi:hypothetical protein